MLCGLYPPTSGTANMMGYDLCYEIDKIHSVLGFCPQYDILYDDLTVEEHFKLIALVSCIIKNIKININIILINYYINYFKRLKDIQLKIFLKKYLV